MNPECTRAFLEILQGAGEGHRVGKVIPKKKQRSEPTGLTKAYKPTMSKLSKVTF